MVDKESCILLKETGDNPLRLTATCLASATPEFYGSPQRPVPPRPCHLVAQGGRSQERNNPLPQLLWQFNKSKMLAKLRRRRNSHRMQSGFWPSRRHWMCGQVEPQQVFFAPVLMCVHGYAHGQRTNEVMLEEGVVRR